MKRFFATVALCVLLAGCSSEPAGPTYAEAVATYQAEVALLDSLRSEKKELEIVYQKEVGKLIDICGDSISKGEIERVLSQAESASDQTLLDTNANVPENDSVFLGFKRAVARKRMSYNALVKSLDDKIAAQRARVDSAMKQRDSLNR